MLFWQWKTSRSSYLLFYLIVAAVTIIGTIIFASGQNGPIGFVGITINSDNGSLGNFNMATLPCAVIFLFVIGCVSFGENIRVALANGVSRRTHYLSFLLFSLIGAAVTSLLGILFDAIPGSFGTSGALSQFSGSFGVLFAFFFTVYLFVIALGYFIAGAYYRMNNLARVLVSIVVPAGLIAFFASTFTFGPYSGSFLNPVLYALLAFSNWMTVTQNAALFFLILAAVFLLLGWSLTRRAPIKPPVE